MPSLASPDDRNGASRQAPAARGRTVIRPAECAQRIADAVVQTWGSTSCAGGSLQVPVGVVAALALVAPGDPDPAQLPAAASAEGFLDALRAIWARFALLRPDLSPNISPLRDWLFDDVDEHRIDALHAVGRAALRSGITDLTGDVDTRRGVDLFGALLMTLRPKSALNGLGQFYTPLPVAQAIARGTGIEPGTRVTDPAVGTGVMLCAAAQVLREDGHDPASVTWIGNDTDELAVACLAVNAHLWGLGPNVLFGVANTLTDPDWMDAALARRTAAIQEWHAIRAIGLLRALTDLAGER